MSIKDGGPAFPTNKRDGHAGAVTSITDKPGMTLRDYFAAKAMAATMSRDLFHAVQIAGNKGTMAEIHARAAYLIADAMLAARSTK